MLLVIEAPAVSHLQQSSIPSGFQPGVDMFRAVVSHRLPVRTTLFSMGAVQKLEDKVTGATVDIVDSRTRN